MKNMLIAVVFLIVSMGFVGEIDYQIELENHRQVECGFCGYAGVYRG